MNTKTIDCYSPRRCQRKAASVLSASTAIVLSSAVYAQQAPTAPAAPTSPSSTAAEEEIVLSPFVVNTERDTGYQPQSTLAGTRLNTPLKDLASGISVLTRDFISDIGASNINELLVYSMGTEAAGSQGNFGAASADDTGSGTRTNPQSSTRARGLVAPTNTRGYFTTAIPTDEYNTDFVTVNRGANAILFGIGSPAGVIDTTLQQASVNKTSTRITHRLGDTGSNRVSLSTNQVLIPRELAFRINALTDRERFMQEPAFEDKDRIYGTVKYVPTRNTTLTASFEAGKTWANRPLVNLPLDSFRLWRESGSRPFNWKRYDDPNYPGYEPKVAGVVLRDEYPSLGEAQVFQNNLLFPRNADLSYTTLANGTPLAGFRSDTPGGTGNNQLRTALPYVPSTENTPAAAVQRNYSGPLNQDLATEVGGLGQGIQWYETANYGDPTDQRARAVAFGIPASTYGVDPSVQWIRPPGQALTNEGFRDYTYFQWDKRMIDETSRTKEKFHNYNVSGNHSFWADERGVNRVGVDLTFNYEEYNRDENLQFIQQNNSAHIRIDPNVYLPTGQLNPNVGRPFVIGGGQVQRNRVYEERENIRATAFLREDFTDSSSPILKWFGRHTLTGLWEQSDLKTVNQSSRLRPFGTAAELVSTNPNGFSRKADIVTYIGESIYNVNADGSQITLKNTPLTFQPVTVGITPGNLGPLTYFSAPVANPATNQPGTPTNVQGGFVNSDITLNEWYQGGNAQRNIITSQAFVLQSYWLKDHLITTAGWRRDERDFARKALAIPAPPAFPTATMTTGSSPQVATNAPAEIIRGYQTVMDYSYEAFALQKPQLAQAGEIKSYNIVARWPQKLLRLPYNADLAVFFGDSENFSTDGAAFNIFQETIPGATGENKEWGINLTIDDKISIRVNRFESAIVNRRTNPTVAQQMYNNAVLQQAAGLWNNNKGANTGVNQEARAEELLATVPGIKSFAAWTVNPINGVASSVTPAVTDTESVEAKGTEVEVTANPFAGLRLTFNVARQEAARANVLPATKRLFDAVNQFYVKYAKYPTGTVSLANYPVLEPMTPDSPVWGTRAEEYWRTQFAEPFAALVATEGTSASEVRKWRANFVANYTFSKDTFLKGWSVGSGIRWQDKAVVGYITDYLPLPAGAAPGTLPTVYTDPNRPVYAPAETNVDAWIGYSRRIYDDKVNWSVRLSARNLFYDDTPIVIRSLGNGQPGLTRIPPEQRFFLQNTFEF